MNVPSFVSWELLYWIPTLTDFLLLVITYTSCILKGPTWWFDNNPEWKEDNKKFESENKQLNTYNMAREKVLWDLAMIAYSGYAVLFVFAFYCCIIDLEQRLPFCWTMTCMMCIKLKHVSDKAARDGIIYWSLPMYGGYAMLKSFVH
mmetsp:Transcript_22541/g.48557  ORF Transcript_22541/g.48557 Transcript_22541/m.48557 type:complete len:147 (+) Transcript_22541:174-614(+)